MLSGATPHFARQARAFGAADRAEQMHPVSLRRRPYSQRAANPEMFARIAERFSGQAKAHNLKTFTKPVTGMLHIHVKGIIFHFRRAPTDTDEEFTFGQIAQHGDFAEQTQRVIPGRNQHGTAETQPRAMGGHVGHEEKRAGGREVIRKVMLEHPCTIVAKGLAQFAIRDNLPVQRRIIEITGPNRCHHEPEFQTVGHAIFATSALPAEKRSTRKH